MTNTPEFTDRELQLIENCKGYATNNPAGFPGHNLMVIIQKLSVLLSKNGIRLLNAKLEGVKNGETSKAKSKAQKTQE